MSEAIAGRLEEWACKEFNFTPTGPKKPFESICRGKMSDVWSFVVSHVKPLPVASHIRHQLKLHGHAASSNDVEPDEMEKDVWRRDMLLADEACSAALNQKTADQLTQLEEKINRDSQAEYVIKTHTALMRNRILYFSTVDRDVELFIAYLTKDSKISKAANYYSRETFGGKAVLSTQPMKLVSDQSKSLFEVFMELTKTLNVGSNTLVKINFEAHHKRFEELIRAYSAKEMMSCLSKLIDERLENLQDKMMSTDFEKEMEDLQFHDDPIEGLTNLSQIEMDKKAKFLMAKRKLLVIEKLRESDKCKERRLSTAKENSSMLNSLLKEANGPLAREWVEFEMELSSCKAELGFLIEMCEGLEKDMGKNVVFKNYVKSTLAEVYSFNAEKARKEFVVKRLISANICSYQKLSARLASMDSLKSKGISSSIAHLKRTPRPCIGGSEVETFVGLADKPLDVAKLNDELVLSSTLTINRNISANDDDSRALNDKTVEDQMLGFKDSKMSLAEGDLLYRQQAEQVKETSSSVDMKNLQKNLAVTYKHKIKVAQLGMRSTDVDS